VTNSSGCISTPSAGIIINGLPMADAGKDQSVFELSTVLLDGTGSLDPDNDALTYLWTAPNGITLSSPNQSRPTFIAPEVSLDTNYTFTLMVNDGTVNSSVDQVMVTVKHRNKLPIANAGNDQSVKEFTQAMLDGTSSSDPDNDALTYLWTAPNGIVLSSATSVKPTFIAPDVISSTDFIFSLVVNDGNLNSAPDQVIVTVTQSNVAPIANAGSDQFVNEGTVVNLNGNDSYDPNGDQISFHWIAPEGITLTSPTTSNPSFLSPVVSSDTDFAFTLIVNDGDLNSVEDQVIVHILKNHVPVANAGPDQSHYQFEQVYLDGSNSLDPDNKALNYLWTAPQGIILSSPNVSNPIFVAPQVSTNTKYTFKLVVNNGYYYSAPDFVDITVKNVNNLPIANAGEDQVVDEGKLTVLDASTSVDPDNDALQYQWTAPSGIILSSMTDIRPSFIAPAVEYDDVFKFYLTVFDGTGYSVPDEVEVKVKQVNTAPIANAGPDQSTDEGVLVTLNGSGSYDQDGNNITYHWIAPAEIKLSSLTDVSPQFSAPEVNVDTNFSIYLVVNDGKINSVADEIIVKVRQINKAPIANAGPNQSVDENSTVKLSGLESSDPDNDNLTYQWIASEGITLSSNTISNPTFVAPEVSYDKSYVFSLIVNDGKLNSEVDKVVIKVLQVNKAPFANAGSDQTVKEKTLVTLDGSGSYDPDLDAITYQWMAPDGITLSSTSSSKPSFTTPEQSSDVKYRFSLIVSDGITSSGPDDVFVFINVDHAPYVVNEVDSVFAYKKDPDQSIDLSTIFADIDQGDILFYNVESNTNPDIVHTRIDKANLILSFSTLNIGNSEITISASSNGKVVNTSFQVIVESPTGFEYEIASDKVQIYPNPTKGNVQIVFSKIPEANSWITVFDISGRMISKFHPDGFLNFVNLNGNPPGPYLIKIDQKVSRTYKLLLED
jgi:hypothetical protein